MTLGDVIKNYRVLNGLSMDAFASKANLSKAYISMLEKNRDPRGKKITPSVETIDKVASAMQMDFDTLINMIDEVIIINVNSKRSLNNSSVLDADMRPETPLRDKDRELESLILSENYDREAKWKFLRYCYELASVSEKNRVINALKAEKRWKEYMKMSDIFRKDS